LEISPDLGHAPESAVAPHQGKVSLHIIEYYAELARLYENDSSPRDPKQGEYKEIDKFNKK
jgi:hypothetical protein